jgi:hypothetical protein
MINVQKWISLYIKIVEVALLCSHVYLTSKQVPHARSTVGISITP